MSMSPTSTSATPKLWEAGILLALAIAGATAYAYLAR
jgi:hypothetical protein